MTHRRVSVKIQVPLHTKNPRMKWLLCYCTKWSLMYEMVIVWNDLTPYILIVNHVIFFVIYVCLVPCTLQLFPCLSDTLHAYLGLGGLSLLGEEGVLPMHAALNISQRASEHLKNLHATWKNWWYSLIDFKL